MEPRKGTINKYKMENTKQTCTQKNWWLEMVENMCFICLKQGKNKSEEGQGYQGEVS